MMYLLLPLAQYTYILNMMMLFSHVALHQGSVGKPVTCSVVSKHIELLRDLIESGLIWPAVGRHTVDMTPQTLLGYTLCTIGVMKPPEGLDHFHPCKSTPFRYYFCKIAHSSSPCSLFLKRVI